MRTSSDNTVRVLQYVDITQGLSVSLLIITFKRIKVRPETQLNYSKVQIKIGFVRQF